MRLLFTTRPTSGHLFPLLPLAEAARRAGHEVAFASAPSTLLQARSLGFDGFPAGREPLNREELSERFSEWTSLQPVSREWNFTRWFAGYEAPERAPDLLAIGKDWHPDLIVNDFAEPATPAVAAKLGIPSVTSGFGVPRPDIAEIIVPWVEPTWRAMDLDVPPHAGMFDHLFLDPCPPSMRPPGVHVPRTQPLRPGAGPPARPDDASKLAQLPPGQVVLVTFGTIFGRSAELYRTVVDSVRNLGRTVVVTLGPLVAPSEMGSMPPNVFCFDFLGQAAVLPRCDLVITHGGSGSTFGPLAHGISLLVIPQGADQFDNAAAVARAGAGLVIQPAEFNRETVEAKARDLLNGSCRPGAKRVAEELAAMPGPDAVIPVLERLAREART